MPRKKNATPTAAQKAAWEWTGERHKLLTVKAARVGGPEGIQADVSYRLNDSGEFERAEEEGV